MCFFSKIEFSLQKPGFPFVLQKIAVYISQNDVHIGEMTAKETLDFSARCQGVGSRYELLTELARWEKDAGIFSEAEVDLFMKLRKLDVTLSNSLRAVDLYAQKGKERLISCKRLLQKRTKSSIGQIKARHTGIYIPVSEFAASFKRFHDLPSTVAANKDEPETLDVSAKGVASL
ncbi:hypothetical protein H6P81_017898 [Aristolochia fimbriata]|uniref:Uncharacterized protein n=1 Tax=Aristolochia fimbriata TaxID=158543 RepID=A0AAV7E1B5_ARIFI|nr:hypothetical protein H6P81_017898 [Aristolochia fimbriata]